MMVVPFWCIPRQREGWNMERVMLEHPKSKSIVTCIQNAKPLKMHDLLAMEFIGEKTFRQMSAQEPAPKAKVHRTVQAKAEPKVRAASSVPKPAAKGVPKAKSEPKGKKGKGKGKGS